MYIILNFLVVIIDNNLNNNKKIKEKSSPINIIEKKKFDWSFPKENKKVTSENEKIDLIEDNFEDIFLLEM